MSMKIPIVILEGSDMANEVFSITEGKGQASGNAHKKEVMNRLAKTKYVKCKDSSEDLASIVHLMLAITLF